MIIPLRNISAVVPGLLLLQPAILPAETLLRGPYLQCASPTNIVIRWRTDAATDSVVQFGTNPPALDQALTNLSVTVEHEMNLTGLQPDTRYFYTIGSTTNWLTGNEAAHCFVTAPEPGAAKLTRVWIIGDAGTQNGEQIAVRDAYQTFTGSRATDVWLLLGDNAYFLGTDAEYQLAVFNVYTNLLATTTAWSTLGNHDAYSIEPGTGNHAYFDLFTFPTNGSAGGLPSNSEHYYAFDHGRIHFICLDSTESDRSPTGPMATWVTNDLAHTSADWIIAFWHHAPYSRGSHNSDIEIELLQMRENIVPLLEKGGVDLVLSGHSHSYERSGLITGHHGPANTFSNFHQLHPGLGRAESGGPYHKPRGTPRPDYGTIYAVVGSSGQISGGLLDHPAMQVSLNQLGSLVLDITSNHLDAVFLGATGATNDWFTLQKFYDPPAAGNGAADMPGDVPAALPLAACDPQQFPLTFSLEQLPTNGLATIPASGNPLVNYLPAHGWFGNDSLSFRAHNGFLRSAAANVSLNVSRPADLNSNQLPDYWENLFGISSPGLDADEDGFSNQQEYLANTNPTNRTSALQFTGIQRNTNGHCTLTWNAVGGTRYRIWYCDTAAGNLFTPLLLPASQEINPAPMGTPNQQSFTDDFTRTPPLTTGRRLYRVGVVTE